MVPAAVKVVKPGVVERVAVDLCVLLRAAEILETWAPRLLPKWRAALERLMHFAAAAVDLSTRVHTASRRPKANVAARRARVAPTAEAGGTPSRCYDDDGCVLYFSCGFCGSMALCCGI